MKLKLVISDNCPACIRTKEMLSNFVKQNPGIDLSIEKINESKERNLSIVPALFINDELFSYGELDKNQLAEIINHE